MSGVSRPRYLNTRGSLPRRGALVAPATARGFRVSQTEGAAVILHDVCVQLWDRLNRRHYCRREDIQVWSLREMGGLSPEPCAEHAAVAV